MYFANLVYVFNYLVWIFYLKLTIGQTRNSPDFTTQNSEFKAWCYVILNLYKLNTTLGLPSQSHANTKISLEVWWWNFRNTIPTSKWKVMKTSKLWRRGVELATSIEVDILSPGPRMTPKADGKVCLFFLLSFSPKEGPIFLKFIECAILRL